MLLTLPQQSSRNARNKPEEKLKKLHQHHQQDPCHWSGKNQDCLHIQLKNTFYLFLDLVIVKFRDMKINPVLPTTIFMIVEMVKVCFSKVHRPQFSLQLTNTITMRVHWRNLQYQQNVWLIQHHLEIWQNPWFTIKIKLILKMTRGRKLILLMWTLCDCLWKIFLFHPGTRNILRSRTMMNDQENGREIVTHQ